MFHPFLPHLGLLLATFSTGISIYTFVSPLGAARQYGFDITPPARDVSSDGGTTVTTKTATAATAGDSTAVDTSLVYVPLFGGRNLALSLAVFVFYFQRHPQAMGTVMMCCAVSAVVDTVVVSTSRFGVEGMAWQHVVGGLVLGGVGLGLVT